jgi:hypothetical protein
LKQTLTNTIPHRHSGNLDFQERDANVTIISGESQKKSLLAVIQSKKIII